MNKLTDEMFDGRRIFAPCLSALAIYIQQQPLRLESITSSSKGANSNVINDSNVSDVF